MDSEFTLKLSDEGTSESQVQDVTRDLQRALQQEGMNATLPQGTPEPGKKGDPLTLGVLIVQAATPAIVALAGVLQAYIARKRSFTFEMTKPDGSKLNVNAENVNSPQFTTILKGFFGQ
ncbi:MAG: hypothetical protein JO033_12515 [Acidobacteriaceae bacterium]|nr:hypothetical protein [Acidobacteriaceae bacterium]MBV9499483.1 hypothetical protein [Acidobacteriaceae bacterium]